MDEMIAEWVRLKVQVARTDRTPADGCRAEVRIPLEIADPYRTIEAVVVRVCGERSYTCPACMEKVDAKFAEHRRATDKAARLWKKILKEYP